MNELCIKWNIPNDIQCTLQEYLSFKPEFDKVINQIHWGIPEIVYNNTNKINYTNEKEEYTKPSLKDIIYVANVEAAIYYFM